MSMTPTDSPSLASTAAVVLAAGLGKRFKADRPKVLFELRGRPLVLWVLEALRQVGVERTIVVVGFQGERVIATCEGSPVEFVWQREQLGTGHAVQQAEPLLRSHTGPTLVLLGDAPLVRPETIRELVGLHLPSQAAATILSAEVPDPGGYGRVVRAPDGSVSRIVEDRDADAATRDIREINSGAICFRTDLLFSVLHRLTKENAQGEYYLTEAVGFLRAEGHRVMAWRAPDPHEVLGVNSPRELEDLERLLTGPPQSSSRGRRA
jgi:bifunctional UDP-N-acetylglucosamine pyrophosphorylase/glucosamine-1-phosphate N-acetyltransferase